MEDNDVHPHPAKQQVLVGDHSVYSYADHKANMGHAIRRGHILRTPSAHNSVAWRLHRIATSWISRPGRFHIYLGASFRLHEVTCCQTSLSVATTQSGGECWWKVTCTESNWRTTNTQKKWTFCQILAVFIPDAIPDTSPQAPLQKPNGCLQHSTYSVCLFRYRQHSTIKCQRQVQVPDGQVWLCLWSTVYNGAVGPSQAKATWGLYSHHNNRVVYLSIRMTNSKNYNKSLITWRLWVSSSVPKMLMSPLSICTYPFWWRKVVVDGA